MRFQVFSVRDNAVEAFLPLFLVRNKGEAIRSFTQAVNDSSHQFAKHREDYTLFHLGEFDDVSGVMLPTEPVRVLSAVEVVQTS